MTMMTKTIPFDRGSRQKKVVFDEAEQKIAQTSEMGQNCDEACLTVNLRFGEIP